MNSLGSVILVGLFLLAACSGKDSEPERKAERKELYKSANVPLEKAKGVEQQLEKSAEEEKKQMDRQLDQ